MGLRIIVLQSKERCGEVYLTFEEAKNIINLLVVKYETLPIIKFSYWKNRSKFGRNGCYFPERKEIRFYHFNLIGDGPKQIALHTVLHEFAHHLVYNRITPGTRVASHGEFFKKCFNEVMSDYLEDQK